MKREKEKVKNEERGGKSEEWRERRKKEKNVGKDKKCNKENEGKRKWRKKWKWRKKEKNLKILLKLEVSKKEF